MRAKPREARSGVAELMPKKEPAPKVEEPQFTGNPRSDKLYVLVSYEMGNGVKFEAAALEAMKHWGDHRVTWGGVRLDHRTEQDFFENRVIQTPSLMIVEGAASCASPDDCEPAERYVSWDGKRQKSVLYIPHDAPKELISRLIAHGIGHALGEEDLSSGPWVMSNRHDRPLSECKQKK